MKYYEAAKGTPRFYVVHIFELRLNFNFFKIFFKVHILDPDLMMCGVIFLR